LAEQQSALLAAIGALPPEQREAFLLHEDTGLTIEEIARVTDVGVETAKSRLRYAIRKLKQSLVTQSAGAVPLRTRYPALTRLQQPVGANSAKMRPFCAGSHS
jgi:predicted RNA polymerase sigma factor